MLMSGSKTSQRLRQFTRIERASGLKGPYLAIKTLHRRVRASNATTSRAKQYARIARGYLA